MILHNNKLLQVEELGEKARRIVKIVVILIKRNKEINL